MTKHIVIIGSGLGGLACGVILSKNGYKVTVLEQHFRIGGCLQCFKRGGVKFETGMHFIGSAGEGQILNHLMSYLGILDQITLSPLSTDGYDVVSIGGKEYRFANGREAFIDRMAGYFPHERKALNRYFDDVEQVARASSIRNIREYGSDLAMDPKYQLRAVNDIIGESVSDPLLAKVLVGNLPLYAGEWGRTPFSTHAFITDFYNQGAYRVVGGSENIAEALAGSIRNNGGEVRTGSRVVQIVCSETQATAVRLSSGETLACDTVISGIHPMRTLELLTDTRLIRAAYRHRISAMPQTIGAFSLYIRFKPDTVPYMNSNYYYYHKDTPWGCEHYTGTTWPEGYMYMHLCHEPHPQYAQSGIVLSYMRMEELEDWKDTVTGHRGEDYEAFKRRKAEKLIDLLSVRFPDIRKNITDYYTSTPLTYRDYTGAEDGGMYGVAKDVSLPVSAGRVAQRTRIPNVFLTGQSTNSHGMLGVLVGAIVTCNELLPPFTIYRQLWEKSL